MAMNNEHAGTILLKIFGNRNEGETIKLTAGVGDQSVLIHRNVLMANSDYFTASLGPNFNKKNQNEFILDETDAPTLEAIVDFCYTGCIDLTEENASKYLAIASSIQLILLEKECFSFYGDKLNIYNAVETLTVADKYSGSEIRQKAFTLVCDAFDKLPPSHIDGLDYRLLKEIIGSDTIDATEEFIFERLMSWFRKDEDNRGKHMPELLKLIRLAFIPLQSLNGNMIQEIYKKFDCSEYLFAEYRRRTACPTSAVGIRRHRSIYCLFAQYKGKDGAEYSAVKYERYNSTLNEFEEVDEIALGDRVDFGVTLHKNKVYVLGGKIDGVFQKSVKMFDLITKKEEDLPEMEAARSDFSLIVYGGHIYVFGGMNASRLNSCERFDLESKAWTVMKPMKTARDSASVAVFHGYIYVAGGRMSDAVRTNVVDLYDPANDDWMQVAPLNGVRSSFALFKSNMSLYAIGGAAAVERYDAMMPRWTKLGSFDKNADVTSSLETGDEIYIVQKTGEFGKIDVFANGVRSFQLMGQSKLKSNLLGQHFLFFN